MRYGDRPWHLGPMISLDLETTGVDSRSDRIVSASIASLNGTTGSLRVREWLIRQEEEIPEVAVQVHGITTAYTLTHGIPARRAVREIIRCLASAQVRGIPLVVFNGQFDLTMLDREARRCDVVPFAPSVVVDPLIIDRFVDRYRSGDKTLVGMVYHYRVGWTGAPHTSSADCIAAARIACRMAQLFPFLRMDPTELHRMQVDWAAQYYGRLKGYREAEGLPDTVDTRWPVVPVEEPVTV